MIDVLESKKIASIYVRVSTQEQKKGWSPDVQRNICLQQAQKCEYIVPNDMIFDEGVSGDFWNRSAFSKLRHAVRERKITAVFMQYSDRISRKAWQQLRFLEECHNAGIKLYIGGQLVDDSRSSNSWFAHF